MRRHLVLVGLPGAGKTTTGRRVAERLGVPFTDIDAALTQATGLSVNAVFSELGEPAFRTLEREAVERALEAAPQVVAPGAGWAAQPGNLEAAVGAGALVAYLRVMIPSAVARLAGSSDRPLLAGPDLEATLDRLLAERESSYLRAGITVDADASVEEVSDRLIRALAAPPGAP